VVARAYRMKTGIKHSVQVSTTGTVAGAVAVASLSSDSVVLQLGRELDHGGHRGGINAQYAVNQHYGRNGY
jgi:hypothetical protein